MKKHIFITFALILGMITMSFAQPERREERIKAYRVAVFTEKLNLSPEEAQSFWPIYNEYTDKRDALIDQFKPGKPVSDMSEAEMETQLARYFERQQKEIDLEKEMVVKMRKFLPLKKVVRIPQAERDFREAIFKKMQERKQEIKERRGNDK